MYPDPESLENPNSIKNVNNLDNDCGDDCSAKLSDVFIDFGSDFGYGINGMTGRIDNREVNIESDNVEHYWRYQGSPPFSSGNIPGNTGSSSPVPSGCEVHLSRLAQHLINQFTYLHTCPPEHHTLLLQNHLHKVRNHRYTNSDCDLQRLVDPTFPRNSYIPDVLNRDDIKIKRPIHLLPK
ncbi:hypothetical protein B0O99DRAFT_622580 [Bisporella sp. PMI_857]|nr:hypothetical protein B0O99DRAFT_622580 [Bisporella sp. PMI_857]